MSRAETWAWRLLIAIALLAAVAAAAMLVVVLVSSATRPTYPPDFEAQVPPGGQVVYTEDRGYRGATRIVEIAGCAIVQGWDKHAARWELSESRGRAFGGTQGIANVDCGAAP